MAPKDNVCFCTLFIYVLMFLDHSSILWLNISVRRVDSDYAGNSSLLTLSLFKDIFTIAVSPVWWYGFVVVVCFLW